MKLKQFSITNGGKFTPETSVVVELKDEHVIAATGDEGCGKTTFVNILLATCGQLGGDQVISDLKNLETGKLEAGLTFVGNDRAEYEVRLTASRLVVRRDGTVMNEPKALLKQMLGIVGTSPMSIKNGDVEDIVKWLAQYSSKGIEEFAAAMKKIKNALKDCRKVRADANSAAKARWNLLQDGGYMDKEKQLIEHTWTAAETKYAKQLDTTELSKRLTAAGKKSDALLQFKTRFEEKKKEQTRLEQEIAALQEKLNVVNGEISEGEKWLEKHKDDSKEYDEVKKEYDNAANFAKEYEAWQTVKKHKAEFDEYETIAQRADSKEKALLKEQQELQWEIIPDIKGMELLLEDEPQEDGTIRKAGFYLDGKNSRQLSESQWLAAVIKILKKNKVKIFIIDGVANLGSKFLETLDGLKKAGHYVVYTEMVRTQETLEIELS